MLFSLLIITLIISPLCVIIVQKFKQKFIYEWLIIIISASIVWFISALIFFQIPKVIYFATWKPVKFFPSSPSIILDFTSWLFIISLSTIYLASNLTDALSIGEEHNNSTTFSQWLITPLLILFTILAVASANLLTLILTWAIIDILEFISWLLLDDKNLAPRQFILSFTQRLLGLLLLITAVIFSYGNKETSGIIQLPTSVASLLFLSACLRLGIIPFSVPYSNNNHPNTAIGSVLRIAPISASLLLLVRLANGNYLSIHNNFFVILTGLTILFSGFIWFTSKSIPFGESFFITLVSSIVAISAIMSIPDSAQVLSIALILNGTFIIMLYFKNKWLFPLLLFSMFIMSGLPFTPTWNSVLIFGSSPILLQFVLILGGIFMFVGYILNFLSNKEAPSGISKGRWTLYIIGLVIPLLMNYSLSIVHFLRDSEKLKLLSNPLTILPPLSILVLSIFTIVLLLIAKKKNIHFPAFNRNLITLEWLYRGLFKAFSKFQVVIDFGRLIMEGRFGLLWTFLFLILLVTFISQIMPGD